MRADGPRPASHKDSANEAQELYLDSQPAREYGCLVLPGGVLSGAALGTLIPR